MYDYTMTELSTAVIREANTIVTDLMQVLRSAQPRNEHLAALSVQLKTMLAANPERLHQLIGNYVIRPHREEILNANDDFIGKLHEEQGDLLGLGSCYSLLSLEEKATVLYGLIRLAKIL